MMLVDDIKGKTYNEFIKYAISKSDAFLLVSISSALPIFDYKDHIKNAKKILPLFDPDDSIIQNLKKLEKESHVEWELFNNCCAPFIKNMEKFKIKQRNNPIWPSTKILEGAEDYNICLYKASHDIIQFLLQPQSYLGWRYPRYPEDLSFFKNNYCWAYASSHEEYIEIIPEDYEEYIRLKEMGIEFQDEYNPAEKKDMFYEAY